MKIDKELLSTNEVADILNRSVNTIYKYVKEKKLRPVYEDKWQIDSTLLFRKEDVLNLHKQLEKPGYTTGEVAEILEIHPTTVSSYIKKGLLKAEKDFHIGLGKEVYFVKEEELERFQREYQPNNKSKQFFIQNGNYYLFQSLRNRESNELGRIIELSKEDGKVMTEQGSFLSLENALEQGYVTVYNIPDHDFIYQKGYATFKFPKPSHISSPIYNVIELLYRYLGRKNIRLENELDWISIGVKPKFIEIDLDKYHYEVELLKKHITDGKIHVRHNGIYIDSDLEAIVIHVRSSFKSLIKNNAAKLGLSMEEYTVNLLHECLERKEKHED